jgi:hypothetical protein
MRLRQPASLRQCVASASNRKEHCETTDCSPFSLGVEISLSVDRGTLVHELSLGLFGCEPCLELASLDGFPGFITRDYVGPDANRCVENPAVLHGSGLGLVSTYKTAYTNGKECLNLQAGLTNNHVEFSLAFRLPDVRLYSWLIRLSGG